MAILTTKAETLLAVGDYPAALRLADSLLAVNRTSLSALLGTLVYLILAFFSFLARFASHPHIDEAELSN